MLPALSHPICQHLCLSSAGTSASCCAAASHSRMPTAFGSCCAGGLLTTDTSASCGFAASLLPAPQPLLVPPPLVALKGLYICSPLLLVDCCFGWRTLLLSPLIASLPLLPPASRPLHLVVLLPLIFICPASCHIASHQPAALQPTPAFASPIDGCCILGIFHPLHPLPPAFVVSHCCLIIDTLVASCRPHSPPIASH